MTVQQVAWCREIAPMAENRKSQGQNSKIIARMQRAEPMQIKGPKIPPSMISQPQVPPSIARLTRLGGRGAAPVAVLTIPPCFLPPPESPGPDA